MAYKLNVTERADELLSHVWRVQAQKSYRTSANDFLTF